MYSRAHCSEKNSCVTTSERAILGKLIYGSGQSEIDIEDRTLAHLKVVIITKLRRDESFALSWENGANSGSGRSTVWVDPAMALEFMFDGGRTPALNRDWIDVLMQAANSAEGLRMIPEPHPVPVAD